jgi:hypothetical protein
MILHVSVTLAAGFAEMRSGELGISHRWSHDVVRPMAIFARNIRLLMLQDGRGQLRMKGMLEGGVFVACEAFNRCNLCLMGNIVCLESRMAGHTDKFPVRGFIKNLFPNEQRDGFP